jgi:Flp pilus assembly pilin Flp
MMWREMKRLVRLDNGQDLIEYTLLLAFVAIISSALFILSGQGAAGIWNQTNNNLNQGIKLASQ